jgi:tetratricopeptide (TPR) repeat protein
MWAERYDRELTDIFAVQDEVTQEIVSALAVQLTREEQDRPAPSGTDNAEAYDYFLRGREQYWLHTREGLTQARQLLRRAIELDPEFAPSYAFLSHSCIQVHINRWHGDGENPLDQALDYARLAVRFDEHYPKSRSSLGNAYMWRREHDLAIEEIHIALTLDPNFASALMELGRLYHYTGRSAEAIDLIERSMRLDPHYPDLYLHSLAQAHFHTGNYDQAVELLKRRLVRKPDTDISRVLLASSYGHLGRIPEAREMWAEALKVNPDYSLAQRRQVLPYKDPADFDLITDGLAKAGISQ